MMTLLLWMACANPEPPAAPELPPEQALPEPAGQIGGEPILPAPVVIGAIAPEAVEAGIRAQMESIRACYEAGRKEKPGLSGKVLVRFFIAKDGSVSSATTRSTSLRHPPTEECVNQRVMEATFAPLEKGESAMVSYPFLFERR